MSVRADRRILPAAQAVLVDQGGRATPPFYTYMRGVIEATGLTPEILAKLQDLLKRLQELEEEIADLDLSQYTKRNVNETIFGRWDFLQPIRGGSGIEDLPEFTFITDDDTGIWNPADNTLAISTEGVQRWDIDTVRTRQIIPALAAIAISGPGVPIPGFTLANGSVSTAGGATLFFQDEGLAGDDLSVRLLLATQGDFSSATPTGNFTGFSIGTYGPTNPSALGGQETLLIQRVNNTGLSNGQTVLGIRADTSQILLSSGSATVPSLSFLADNDTGIYRVTSNILGFTTAAINRLSISTTEFTATLPWLGPNGTIGAPSYAFASDPDTGIYLQAVGEMRLVADATTNLVVGAAGLYGFFRDGLAGTPSMTFLSDTDSGLFRPGANLLGLATAGALRFQVGAAGELGIGGATYGAAGQVLTSGGPGAPPMWADASGGGSGGLAYANTSVPGGNTIANTVTETAFASSYTIPGGQLQAGTVVRLKLFGVFGTDAAAPTLRIRAKLGATTVLDSGAQTVTANLTDQGWAVDASMVCFTGGATGTLDAQGVAEFATGAADGQLVNMENAATSAVDTTGTLALTVTVEWGTANASNTITLREMTVDLLDPVTPTAAAPASASYLTTDDETADLPNSRRLIAGTNISFDDTTPGQRTVNASGSGNLTPDTHPSSPTAIDDEFEFGSTIDTTGARRPGATGWVLTTYSGSAASTAQSQGSIVLNSSGGLNAYRQPIPGSLSAYKVRAKAAMPDASSNFQQAGIHLYHSGTTRWMTMQFVRNASLRFEVAKWTAGSFNAASATEPLGAETFYRNWIYLECEYTGSLVVFRYSLTGVDGTFRQVFSESLSTFFGGGNVPNYAGIHGQPSGGGNFVSVMDWFRRVA